MGQNCLTALALIHINLDVYIDAKRVLKYLVVNLPDSFDLIHLVFSKQYTSILISMFFRLS